MSSFIVKITQNGSSQEYLFNRPGPIVIGSDERADLVLSDSHIEGKLLEIKVSGGKIFIKELGTRSYIYLNSVILPFREEVLYHEDQTISVRDSNYQIHIQQLEETGEPPPFFETDFRARLDMMTADLKSREKDLKRLGQEEQKKSEKISELDEKFHAALKDRAQIEAEVSGLSVRKEGLLKGIEETVLENREHKDKSALLNSRIQQLMQEEQRLSEQLLNMHQSLSTLKEEKEELAGQIGERHRALAGLECQTSQINSEISQLNREKSEGQGEIQNEKIKLQQLLKNADDAIKERKKIESHLRKLLNEKSDLEVDTDKVRTKVVELKTERSVVEVELQELRSSILSEEARYKEILEGIDLLRVEEAQLKDLNVELRSELNKAENKLRMKKDEFIQFDGLSQDLMRKLTTTTFELERGENQLRFLISEEETRKLKIESLNQEISVLQRKALDQKKDVQRAHEEDRNRLSLELTNLEGELETRRKEHQDLEFSLKLLEDKHDKEDKDYRELLSIKSALEAEVSKATSERALVFKERELLRSDILRLCEEKSRAEKDLTLLNLKVLDTENKIREREEKARSGIEEFKREERTRMLAEKEILLSEVEAFKQKSLIEVDHFMKKRQDEVWKVEEEIVREARIRLQEVTSLAEEREVRAHDRMKEAQNYFKQKEAEADSLIQKSKLEARDLQKKSENELLEDLARRKQKIKRFLSMKQEQGLAHLKLLEDQHQSRMKKAIIKGQESIEHLKRRELKRIARLKEEELAKIQEIKGHALKDANLEKDKIRRQTITMKTQQEIELADTKKKVLEHINQLKISQQNAWEDELKGQKMIFEQSKRARIENAASAMVNLMSSEFGLTTDEKVRDKVQDTLRMAIDGQNAEALLHVGQILDINPELRKKVLPVLKKYVLHFGVPAAVILIMLADIGSIRTGIVNSSKQWMKQDQSASDIFVKQQKEAWKDKYTFSPPTTAGYKGSFTDNVLYTTQFEAVMDDEVYQNDWILKVHDFMVKELELSEDVAISYISSEGTLIKELANLKKEITPQFKDQGIAKLVAAEETHLGWLKQKFSDPVKAQKFSDFRKKSFDDFYAQKYSGRDVASEPQSK